jgi:hypothetical protein
MSYRIVETTDRRHLGKLIGSAVAPGDLLLLGGCEIRVESVAKSGSNAIVSNPNYVIFAIKE